MASYPPPYPPPPGAPYGYDPKQQRRFLRDQMKAQNRAHKDASRAVIQAAAVQRAAYRQQMKAMRRGSILGPLVIVAIGVTALLIRSGKIPFQSFARWYGHWWPLLLVGAGVVLVLEWAFDQRPNAEGRPYVRRGMGGGAVFLLIVLAVTGACIAAYHDGGEFIMHDLSINPENVDEIFGEKHEMAQPVDEDFPVGGGLVIDNPHGDVTISGTSGDGKLHMIVNKQVWTRSDEAADEKAQKLNAVIGHTTEMIGGAANNNALTVQIPSLPGGSADLTITMPESGNVTVTANHGSVNISAMKAPVTVTANHGDVDLNSIAGAVIAHLNHRDSSFTAHSVTGDVAVRGHAQDVNVTDVMGQVSMEGEFFGETHLQHLAGPVNFRTSRTQFSLGKLDGEVDISPNSELTGNQIVGPTVLRTSSRNISFERVAGDIDVANSKGSVDLTSSAPLGNVSIQNRDGAVSLTLPEHAGAVIDAETRGGEVESDLGLAQTMENDRAALRGSVGDGAARVMIRTNHFDIEIHKGTVEPPASATPIPPTPPAAPAAPAKPIKSKKALKPAVEA